MTASNELIGVLKFLHFHRPTIAEKNYAYLKIKEKTKNDIGWTKVIYDSDFEFYIYIGEEEDENDISVGFGKFQREKPDIDTKEINVVDLSLSKHFELRNHVNDLMMQIDNPNVLSSAKNSITICNDDETESFKSEKTGQMINTSKFQRAVLAYIINEWKKTANSTNTNLAGMYTNFQKILKNTVQHAENDFLNSSFPGGILANIKLLEIMTNIDVTDQFKENLLATFFTDIINSSNPIFSEFSSKVITTLLNNGYIEQLESNAYSILSKANETWDKAKNSKEWMEFFENIYFGGHLFLIAFYLFRSLSKVENPNQEQYLRMSRVCDEKWVTLFASMGNTLDNTVNNNRMFDIHRNYIQKIRKAKDRETALKYANELIQIKMFYPMNFIEKLVD